jgi:hypothetical protein
MSTTVTSPVKRIRWNEDEKLGLTLALIERQRMYPEESLLKALVHAQGVLNDDRRRKIAAKSEIAWIDEYVEKVTAAKEGRLPPDQIPEELVPQLEMQLQDPPPVAHDPNLVDLRTVPLQVLAEAWFGRYFAEKLEPRLEELTDALVAKKAAAMLEQLQTQRGEKGRLHIVVPAQVRKAMRPKVLVLGLLGSQVTTIKQKYGQELDLTLVGSDHNHDGLESLAKSHDVGIVMTRFINHSQQDKVKNNAPHTIMVSGATTDLSNILHSLVKQGLEHTKQHNYTERIYA